MLRNRTALWGALVFCCVLGIPEVGLGAERSDASLAAALLDALGVDRELEALEAEAIAQFGRHTTRVATGDRAALGVIIATGFDSATLSARVRRALQADFDRSQALEAERWLSRPELQQALAGGSTCSQRVEPGSGAKPGGGQGAAPPERAKLVARVGSRLGAPARARLRADLVFEAMLVAGNAALPRARRLPDEEIQVLIVHQRSRTHAGEAAALRCAYRDVSTKALRTTASFLDAPAGRWLQAAVEAAIADALRAAAEATAVQIIDTFGTPAPLHVAVH